MLTITQQRVVTVLERLITMAKDDADDAQMLSEALEPMLNGILSGDGFGTEGQCDPRGDGRNGIWSMRHVEGVDCSNSFPVR